MAALWPAGSTLRPAGGASCPDLFLPSADFRALTRGHLLDRHDLSHAPVVAPTGKGRREDDPHDRAREPAPHAPGPEHEHVGVVVLAAVPRRPFVVTERRA